MGGGGGGGEGAADASDAVHASFQALLSACIVRYLVSYLHVIMY